MEQLLDLTRTISRGLQEATRERERAEAGLEGLPLPFPMAGHSFGGGDAVRRGCGVPENHPAFPTACHTCNIMQGTRCQEAVAR